MNILVLGCLWVLAASATAMLPMRYQFPPGLALLIAAPVLIWQIGAEYGWLPLLLAAAAFVSMFRKPLKHLVGKLLGRKPGDTASQSGGASQ